MHIGINSDSPGSAWIQADVHCAMSDESREIWTNLDKSEHFSQESAIHSAGLKMLVKNSPPL